LIIVCHDFSFHGLPPARVISRSKGINGIRLFSPLASIPATAQYRTNAEPYQQGRRDQHCQSLRPAIQCGKAEHN
jgi:hypothetical protein